MTRGDAFLNKNRWERGGLRSVTKTLITYLNKLLFFLMITQYHIEFTKMVKHGKV